MTRTTDDQLEAFFGTFAHAQRALLLLDYDGTLAPFRVDRFKARPWAGVRELLNRIQDPGEVAITTKIIFISGRPAAEIGPLIDLKIPAEIWGLHGAERVCADGERELDEAPEETRAKLDELRVQLRSNSFGGLLEEKPNAVVMHWRGVSSHKAQKIAQMTRETFEPLSHLDGLTLLEFESGLELRTGRDKGGAVRAILEGTGEDDLQSPVAFLGDDVTDEAAFAAVNASERPHLTVLVRHAIRETAAAVWLQPPGELKGFLKRWIAACGR
jgi:trehalose 6-phosphate synthase/trehalose 6-phosphate phosphatase